MMGRFELFSIMMYSSSMLYGPQLPIRGSFDNLFSDPYQSDGQTSFSLRTPMVSSYASLPVNQPIHSVENGSNLREQSYSTDWGRSSLNLPLFPYGDNSGREKHEGTDSEHHLEGTPDPAFFNQFMHVGSVFSPPPEDGGFSEGRRSGLSGGDPDSMHLIGELFIVTALRFPQPAPPIYTPPVELKSPGVKSPVMERKSVDNLLMNSLEGLQRQLTEHDTDENKRKLK